MKRTIAETILLLLVVGAIGMKTEVVRAAELSNGTIIDPQPGQYANYSHSKYYPDGTVIWSGWWNTSYLNYAGPELINTTNTIARPEYGNGTFWFTVDKTTRWITSGNSWVVDTYFFEWIETEVDIGSVIDIWVTTGEVIDSKTLGVTLDGCEKSIDCWVVNWTAPYLFMSYFDKQSGLLIADVFEWLPYEPELGNNTLVSTNIPIGAIPTWEIVCEDPRRGTILRISTDDQFVQFAAPDRTFSIKHCPDMMTGPLIIIKLEDDEIILRARVVAVGRWSICTAYAKDVETGSIYLLIDRPQGTGGGTLRQTTTK